jgi:hypothetical protein
MTYASEVLADSPLLWWRLGDASGTTAADSSGNGRNGTYSGGPTLGGASLLTSDPSNTAVTFDGVDDRVTIADTTDLTSFTVEAWIKTSTNGTIIARRDGAGTNFLFSLEINSGNIRAIVRNSSGTQMIVTGTNVTDNAVHHVALTYNGSNVRVFKDGVRVGLDFLSGALSTADRMLEVGVYGSDATAFNRFTGTIDEVAYYSTALADARITAHYTAGTAAPPLTIHPNKITSTGTVRAPSIVPYVAPVDGNITITAELAPARWSAAATQPDRTAEIKPARLTAGVQS